MIYKPGFCPACYKQMEITNLVVIVHQDTSARHAGLCWRATYDAYCHNCKKPYPLRISHGRLPPEFQDGYTPTEEGTKVPDPYFYPGAAPYVVSDEAAVLDPAVWLKECSEASKKAANRKAAKARKRKQV